MPALVYPDPPLETDGLRLRPLTPEDAPALAEAAGHPDIVEFAYGNRFDLGDLEVARDFVEVRIPDFFARGAAVMLGVFDVEERLLGSTLLWNLNLEDGWGELGFWAAPFARGRGVVTKAVRAKCEWGFETLGLHRIEALTDPANPPSDAVLERLGFTFEGVRRGIDKRPDGFHDCRVWSLLATDPR